MKKNNKIKPYLTPNEVAELLMVAPVTVRMWANKGILNAETTPGGHRRFMRHEVIRFASEHGINLPQVDEDILRIMIVDDEEKLVSYLVELFTSKLNNIAIETANDGFQAGKKVQAFNPHIVLLDIMMPGLNGIEVCRQLKADPQTSSIRVIAMTGYYSHQNVTSILDAGAEKCLAKPLDASELLSVIDIRNRQSSFK
ncbi:MAG: response regulator [Gammaproteobacteria bacterium]|nr:response regulator [Gammaproteobacteria bacterium]